QFKGGPNEFDNVKILPVELQVPYLQLGDQVQVPDNINQAVYPLAGPFQVFLSELLVLHRPIQKRKNIALDRKEGGLELVGYIAQKILSVFLPDLQGVDFDLLPLREPSDLLGKGLHVPGHGPGGKGGGFQKRHIVVYPFDAPVNKAFHPDLYDGKTQYKTEDGQQQNGPKVHGVPKPK